MYIEYMPVKTDYMVTDTALDFTGLVGKVVYNSGRTFDLKTLIDNKMLTQQSVMLILNCW